MKRTSLLQRTSGLRRESAKRRALREERARVRLIVFARDSWRCQAGVLPALRHYSPCFGALTPHHVVKASQGGKYEEQNLVTLCAHHNELLESDANFARLGRRYGLVRRGKATD